MVEGPTEKETENLARLIAGAVEKKLG